MKKSFVVCLLTLSIGIFSAVNAHAQDTTTAGKDVKNAARKTGKAIKKDTKKVGNKTAKIASSAKSAVVDKVYKGKVGPDGQKIYIDGQSKYYFIDEKGHKQYVAESKLKDK